MHWLMRSTLVVLVVALLGDWSYPFMQMAWERLAIWIMPNPYWWMAEHVVLMGWIGMLVALALAIDWYLQRWRKPEPLDVPRCKCGYPLVGLSEPRCPECGEWI